MKKKKKFTQPKAKKKQAPQPKIGLANRSIAIDQALCYRDDTYCEVVRPTYSLFHITVFLMISIFMFFTVLCVAGSQAKSGITLLSCFSFYITIMTPIYLLLLLSKDFSIHLKQPYYQPIVFNRKQQKVYIYYNDSKENIKDIVILNMADLTPYLEVKSHHQRRTSAKGSDRYFFDARLCVKDLQGNSYPLFHYFYSTYFSGNLQQDGQELLDSVEGELAGYWNWCEAYMNYQDELLTDSKTTWYFFRARWPAHIRHQFMQDKQQQL